MQIDVEIPSKSKKLCKLSFPYLCLKRILIRNTKLNNKRYIGSAKDLYLRLIEYLADKKSNTALQKSILKYGLDKFYFCVYEYFTYHKVVSNKALTDLKTSYIEKYPFNSLYIFM